MNDGWIPVNVSRVEALAESVVGIDLTTDVPGRLPVWEPGAHVDLKLPNGVVRQYSLCGDPNLEDTYRIAVLKELDGRGGSLFIHDHITPGVPLEIRAPRNHFPLDENATSHLLIAGGIGITPILAMARHLARREGDWRCVYGGRNRASMAFAEDLTALDKDRVNLVPQDVQGLIDLEDVIGMSAPGTAVYVCGPAPLISATQEVVQRIGERTLGFERFQANARTDSQLDIEEGLPEFEVELHQTGKVIRVREGETLLHAIRRHTPNVAFSCEQGYCGSCETRVIAGKPVHRDTIIDPADRESSEYMMICVGGSNSDRLVLDL